MRALKLWLLAFLCSSTAAWAAPASEDSIRELLAVTQASKLLEGVRAQLDGLRANLVRETLGGRTPTPAQQQAIERMTSRMVAVLQSELTWEKLEPMYLRLYRDSFTEEEIGGMLAFYRTPAGQAVIGKMPMVMQNTMVEVQRMIAALAPRMQRIEQDFVAELKAAGQ